MRAVGVVEYGGPEALREVDVAREALGDGQVRVRVLAAAVNPTDTLVVNGSRTDADRAAGVADVPGMDVGGEVVEVGPGTDTDLAPGERVMAVVVPSGEHGAYRDEVVLPVGSVVRAPAGTSHAEASTLPMNGLTARLTLEALDLAPGQVLAVTGAAGAYGGYLVQLAKADGITVVADAAEKDEGLVRSFGADHVVRRGDDVAERIRVLFPDGVDALADGAVQGDKVTAAVKDGGGVATVRFWEGDGTRGLRFHPIRVREGAERRDLLERLREQAESGEVALRVADVLPAAHAGEAHERLAAGGVRGRMVLDFS
ncbi:NADP-dependent oxidoreductase [Actinokineospora bangkokensis]|uniref:Alcohol dehydrogenase n=1 Tax=Actinokineospora bangkokensis TaxID=1193682 RepID=A0A1Q9LJV7_9PSEU|nr:NADP-dependent oxidoreductase [Actinokineospora bangkokensis]OLR92275.1 alcohol dehydrogenase [Actinokineospora bangkokensis]